MVPGEPPLDIVPPDATSVEGPGAVPIPKSHPGHPEPLFPAPPSPDANREVAFISAGLSAAINVITLEFP